MPRTKALNASVVILGCAIVLAVACGCSNDVQQGGEMQEKAGAMTESEAMPSDVSSVDDGIWDLVHGSDWLAADIEGRRAMANDLLQGYKEQGLIIDYSYVESVMLFTYKYPDGISGVIPLEVFDSDKN